VTQDLVADIRALRTQGKERLQRRRSLLRLRRVLSALLDGKLTFTPRPDQRYEITGRIVTGALVHLPACPQGDSRYGEHERLRDVEGMDRADFPHGVATAMVG
jgi:hypothetical protein